MNASTSKPLQPSIQIQSIDIEDDIYICDASTLTQIQGSYSESPLLVREAERGIFYKRENKIAYSASKLVFEIFCRIVILVLRVVRGIQAHSTKR
jgi:hypothetical protein